MTYIRSGTMLEYTCSSTILHFYSTNDATLVARVTILINIDEVNDQCSKVFFSTSQLEYTFVVVTLQLYEPERPLCEENKNMC